MFKLISVVLMLFMISTSVFASEEVPTQEEVAELYVATFNRAPDKDGLDYWTTTSGLKLSGIAQSFFDQPETQTLYPSDTTNSSFIESVYQNLFNRSADSLGLAYWKAELDNGAYTKNMFIQVIIGGAKGESASASDKAILDNKKEVGLHFANQNVDDSDGSQARSVMSGVTADASTVTTIKSTIDGMSENTTSSISMENLSYSNEKIINNRNDDILLNNLIINMSGYLIVEGEKATFTGTVNYLQDFVIVNIVGYPSQTVNNIGLDDLYPMPMTIPAKDILEFPTSANLTGIFAGVDSGKVEAVHTLNTDAGDLVHTTILDF